MKLEEMEQMLKKTEKGCCDPEFDETGEDELYIQDALEAIGLLKKCMYLMFVYGDKDLTKISQRERLVMEGLASTVKSFLDDVEEHYTEEE